MQRWVGLGVIAKSFTAIARARTRWARPFTRHWPTDGIAARCQSTNERTYRARTRFPRIVRHRQRLLLHRNV